MKAISEVGRLKGTAASRRLVLQLPVLMLGLFAALHSNATTQVERKAAFDYDPITGALIKEISEKDDSRTCLVKAYTLDAYGHRQVTKTRNCDPSSTPKVTGGPSETSAPGAPYLFPIRTRTESYSSNQQFLAGATNDLFNEGTQVVDQATGALLAKTDANQLATGWALDGLGRKVLEKRPDGNGTAWTYEYCSSASINGVTGTASCSSVTTTDFSSGIVVTYSYISPAYVITEKPVAGPIDLVAKTSGVANGPYVKRYYDALNHLLKTETESNDCNSTGSVSTEAIYYDGASRVIGRSRPGAADWVRFDLDALGRVKAVTENNAGGTAITTTTYSGQKTYVKNPRGYITTISRNAAGQVESITDAKNGVLSKKYDPFLNLVETKDDKGNITSAVYDTPGRRIRLYDPDMGSWSYDYDPLGQLVTQTDAKNQQTSIGYDKVGRVLTRAEPSLNSTWVYDAGASCGKGIGKLCSTSVNSVDYAYSKALTYDAYSRLGTSLSTIGGVAYSTGNNYDANDRLASVVYPDGLSVSNTYSGKGYLCSIKDDRSNVVVWKGNSFDAAGRVLNYTYGNGLTSSDSYYSDGRLNTRQSGVGNAVQSLSHTYDLNGNLAVRYDVNSGVSASYAYDELDRLTQETRSGGALASAAITSWDFDSIGNMVKRTEQGYANEYNYPSSGSGSRGPHAVANIGGFVNGLAVPFYKYDENGALTSGAGRTVSWTSFGMVDTITKGGSQVTYRYDTELQRAIERSYVNGVLQHSTVYLNPASGAGLHYEEDNGVAGLKRRHYITAYGQKVASIISDGVNWTTQYWHTDHLGSISSVSDGQGAVLERMAYEPFGKRRYSNGTTDVYGALVPAATDRGYTGHEHIDEVGLINMNGRVYDPGLGRFLSPDPTVPNINNLQDFNRYSYVDNGPTDKTDPTGFDPRYINAQIGLSYDGSPNSNAGLGGFELNRNYNNNISPVSVDVGGQFSNTVSNSPASAVAAMGGSILDGPSRQQIWNQGMCSTPSVACQQQNARFAEEYKRREQGEALGHLESETATVATMFLPALRLGKVATEAVVEGFAAKGVGEASSLANAARLRGQLAGKEIAGGHAFEKHVLNLGEFKGLGIRTREQFANHIENVVNNPTASRQLSGGRSAYWQESTGTVVIRNPRAADGGTAFQPTNGRAYFDGLR